MHKPGGGFIDGLKHFNPKIFFRARTLIYMGMWSLIGLGLVFLLLTRDRLEVNVQKDRNPIAVKLSDGSIRNGYTMKILNMMPEPRTITLMIDGPPGASMTINEMEGVVGRSADIPSRPDKLRALHVFVTVPGQLASKGRTDSASP